MVNLLGRFIILNTCGLFVDFIQSYFASFPSGVVYQYNSTARTARIQGEKKTEK